jgi:hypothetical protein
MRAYRALLQRLVEESPATFARLPCGFLADQAARLLRGGDIYLLEQLDRRVPVLGGLDPAELARAAALARHECRVDDFCFLYPHLAEPDRPGSATVSEFYQDLARRGLVGGIEQVARLTGVRPELSEPTATQAYRVLIGAGRLDAADYVRQLSGVPVRPDPAAVAAGARYLLATDQYGALRRLARLAGPVRLGRGELAAAAGRAAACGRLTELAAAAAQAGAAGTVTGFRGRLAGLAQAGRLRDAPALFTLCADADAGCLDGEAWRVMLTSGEATPTRFAYQHCPDARLLEQHADQACRLAADAGDRVLARLACELGASLGPDDARRLTADALDELDLDWLRFARRQPGGLPAAGADAVQLFLGTVSRERPGDLEAACALVGTRPDEQLGEWLYGLASGDPTLADRAARQLPGHAIAAAVYGEPGPTMEGRPGRRWDG